MSVRRLRALIVDDEASARRLLLRLLGDHPQIEVVGEAASVDRALGLCTRLEPDVVFLDVQMRGELGFRLLELLPKAPAIVWVTAHLEYTLKAFEVGSSDYLLKPVGANRLAVTVSRLLAKAGIISGTAGSEVASESVAEDATVMLSVGSVITRIRLSDIALVLADGAYTKITMVSGKAHVVLRGISSWEKTVPRAYFLRISRFHLLNRRAVLKFERCNANRSIVQVEGLSAPLILSRRAAVRMRAWLRRDARSLLK
jgi:two-component system LytT family response regulator